MAAVANLHPLARERALALGIRSTVGPALRGLRIALVTDAAFDCPIQLAVNVLKLAAGDWGEAARRVIVIARTAEMPMFTDDMWLRQRNTEPRGNLRQ
jgi:hypothetical protein